MSSFPVFHLKKYVFVYPFTFTIGVLVCVLIECRKARNSSYRNKRQEAYSAKLSNYQEQEAAKIAKLRALMNNK